MKKVKLKSPAKLNLTLEVTKKLSNGFHLIRSVMTKIDELFDEIELDFSKKEKRIKIFCNNENVPCDEGNIVWKITDKFFKATGIDVGIKIWIKKKIPIGAGLGGGSSNGGTVLLALNNYFNKPLSKKQLIELAGSVGKDIPFFLSGSRVAYVEGMGEKIFEIKKFPKWCYLVVCPPREISTPWAYGELDKTFSCMADAKRKNISKKLIRNMMKTRQLSLYNDFRPIALSVCPEISVIENIMSSFGALDVSITGKGPTTFGVFGSHKEMDNVIRIIKKKYPDFLIIAG